MTMIFNGSTGITYPDGSGQATSVVFINNQTITANFTMSANTSGSMTGPIYISNSAVFTIPSGARAVIL
jgi:hypothetical protein